MNKDLDDRIIPPGEYRDAMNINVSKSEDGNIGAVETVKGNNKILDLNYGEQVIGSCEDFANDRVFLFITNFIDNSSDEISNQAPYGTRHRVVMITNPTDSSATLTVLSQGSFLNFSTTHLIQASILEDLLFFTDNRNQPRRINISKAILNGVAYHDNEDKVSVAKYAPTEGYAGRVYNISDITAIHKMNLHRSLDLDSDGSPEALSYKLLKLTTGDTSKLYPGMPVIGLYPNQDFDVYIHRIIDGTDMIIDSKDRSSFVTNAANETDVRTLRFVRPSSINVTQKFDPTPSVKIIVLEVATGQWGITKFTDPGTGSALNNVLMAGGATNIAVRYHLDDAREARNIVSGMYMTADWIDTPAKIKLFDAPMGQYANNVDSSNEVNGENIGGLKNTSGRHANVGNSNLFLDPNENGGIGTLTERVNNDEDLMLREAYLHYPNPYYDNRITADEDYLKERIIRFAYRFKFEDNEYSLISPFTQSIFVPPSYGFMSALNANPYNVSTTQVGAAPNSGARNLGDQLVQAGLTGKLDFLENNCNQVNVRLPMPVVASSLASELHVKEIEVLYKESDFNEVKIVKSIKASDLSSNNTKFVEYEYNSEPAYKTIPDKHLTRIYDKVPVKALAQSITGNRVVYGNYLDKYTSPQNLQYRCAVSDKFSHNTAFNYSERTQVGKDNFSKISYPCSSLKHNRTYTVGVVLSDRYGRSSDVILAAPQTQNKQTYLGVEYGNGEVTVPYLKGGASLNGFDGSSLKMLFLANVPSNVDRSSGIYGVYVPYKSSYTATDNGVNNDGNARKATITVPGVEQSRIQVGDRVKGSFGVGTLSAYNASNGRIEVSHDSGTTSNQVTGNIDIYHKNYNPLGWYSYKVVVLDKAEEYYNLYLPSAKAGILELDQTTITSLEKVDTISHIPLRGDNINKLSIDYNDVSDNQKEFSTTTDKLYPRIQTATNIYTAARINRNSVQSPIDSEFTVKAVANLSDLVTDYNTTGNAQKYSQQVFEGGDIRVAQINTTHRFGNVEYGMPSSSATYPFMPALGTNISNLSPVVMEVEPAESKIEIYYETATCGLVEDLNYAIGNSSTQDADGNTVTNSTQVTSGTATHQVSYLAANEATE